MPDQSDQEVLLANVRKWREEQERRKLKRVAQAEFPKFRKLVEYEIEELTEEAQASRAFPKATPLKGWMTVPGGASNDGK